MERRFRTLRKNARKLWPPKRGWTGGFLHFLAPRPAALVLYRLFLARMIDVEILSAGGDVRDLVVRSVSILSALSFVLAYLIVPRYTSTSLPRARLLFSIWNDQEFLLSGTIAVAGLFSVLAWNAVFPDRRDCYVLTPLPVSTGAMILAKLAAMATGLSIGLIAINAFTGLGFPPAVAGPAGRVPFARRMVDYRIRSRRIHVFGDAGGSGGRGAIAELVVVYARLRAFANDCTLRGSRSFLCDASLRGDHAASGLRDSDSALLLVHWPSASA